MELQQFVTESLSQIINGVAHAQAKINLRGVEINPDLTNQIARGLKLPADVLVSSGARAVVMVHFDVAVTITEGTGTKGGIGVFVGAVGLGSQGQSDKSSTSATKIQFHVPVALPY